jgi:ABC-type lipoprotein release transport system permease subunit
MSERTRVLVRIALRNLVRQARRSVLTASAMVLGIGLLMFVVALQTGAHVMYVDSAVRMGTGHVTLEHAEYAGSRDLGHRIPAAGLALAEAAIRQAVHPGDLRAIFPRVTVGGLIQSASSAIPVRIQGVDADREAGVSFMADKVVAGRFLEPADRLGAIIGAGVASRLRAGPGSRLVVMAQGAAGELESQLVIVVGIFETGIPEVDRGVVQIPIATAREWLAIGDDATSLSAVLASDRRTEAVTRSVRAGLPAGTPIVVMSWREAHPDLYAGLQADKAATYVVFLVLVAIVALAVVNSVLMAVLSRTREFGVLRAMGLDRSAVGLMVVIEGTVLTVASGVAGLLLGAAVAFGLFRDGVNLAALIDIEDLAFGGAVMEPVVFPVLAAGDLAIILAIVMVAGVLASLYPARRATRIQPADAIGSGD